MVVAGNDARGVLFGVGRLLRCLHTDRQSVAVPADLNLATAPHSPIRGHQLGYRPKTNSYDGWDVAQWEQYIRDLAVFGANSVELIPPRSDDAADSPHFPLPPMQMMIAMSRLLDSYGMDVWVWYPAMDPDYSDPKTVDFGFASGARYSGRCRASTRLRSGGDPGHTEPRVLMNLLAKQAKCFTSITQAGIWVSPQGLSQEWLETFWRFLTGAPVLAEGRSFRSAGCASACPNCAPAFPRSILSATILTSPTAASASIHRLLGRRLRAD